MLNATYRKAALAVKQMNAKGEGVYGSLLTFAHEHRINGTDALKAHFKQQETLANAEFKYEIAKNSTYRVAKSMFVKACELGIDLMRDGKPVGKTELGEKIKEVEEAEAGGPTPPKTDFDKFVDAVNKASKLADGLDGAAATIAAGLVSELYRKVEARMPMPKAA